MRVKLYEHMSAKDHSLDDLFAIMDRDKNNSIDIEEFKRGVKDALSDHQAQVLFNAIDIDKSLTLTRDEIAIELSTINCA